MLSLNFTITLVHIVKDVLYKFCSFSKLKSLFEVEVEIEFNLPYKQ